jgi:4a-hydroxytetrahydrobiopterin dehydratase
MAGTLDDAQVTAALADLPGWSGDATGLSRTAELPDFPTAITVVDEVAVQAELADHHPDIDIRWRSVTFACATHSEGGVTDKDLQLAQAISTIVTAHNGS